MENQDFPHQLNTLLLCQYCFISTIKKRIYSAHYAPKTHKSTNNVVQNIEYKPAIKKNKQYMHKQTHLVNKYITLLIWIHSIVIKQHFGTLQYHIGITTQHYVCHNVDLYSANLVIKLSRQICECLIQA